MADYSMLVQKAYEAQKRSYCPYSHWAVGAALLTKEGRIYLGCNIENNTFTPTVCAERVAFFKAVFEGERDFVAIAIVGNGADSPIQDGDICPPCGVCRQVMTEFCSPDFEIVLGSHGGKYEVHTLKELMPVVSLPLKQ